MDYIVQLWGKHLEPLLTPLWNCLFLWRSLSLLLVTTAVVAYLYRHKIMRVILRDKYRDHDRGIFAQSDQILSEQPVYDMLDDLESDHSYNGDSFTQMRRFLSFHDLEANRYLDKRLHLAAKRLSGAIDGLTDFVAYNFWSSPSSPNLYFLHPRLNIDRGGHGSLEDMNRYDQYAAKLRGLTKTVRTTYRDYRSIVKNRLLK